MHVLRRPTRHAGVSSAVIRSRGSPSPRARCANAEVSSILVAQSVGPGCLNVSALMNRKSTTEGASVSNRITEASSGLFKAREAIKTAFAGLTEAVKAASAEEMAATPTNTLYIVLTDILTYKDSPVTCEVVGKLVEAIPEGTNLSRDEHGALILKFSGNPSFPVVADEGRPNKVGAMLIRACKSSTERCPGKPEVLKTLIKEGLIGEDMVNTVVANLMAIGAAKFLMGLDRINACQAPTLSAFFENVKEFAKNVARDRCFGDKAYGDSQVVADAARRLSTAYGDYSALSNFVADLSGDEGCRQAVVAAGMFPEFFDVARDAVLRSGSPEALAEFYHAHSSKCDKEVFREKLAKAMQPDPMQMAEAVLDRRGGRGDFFGFPYHPMMMGMGPGPFGRW